MKKKIITLFAVGAVVSVGSSVLATNVKADSNVYRLYNQNTGEHFYTTSAAEKNADVSAGWNYEGIGWVAPSSSTTPVYRVYNPNAKGGDHYYTKSKAEATSLVKLGWKWDNAGKPVFYSGYSTPVYVAYNPNASSGAHNYTTSKFEQDNLLKGGWKFSAVAWYGKAYVAPVAPTNPSTAFSKGEGTYTVGNQIPVGKYTITSVTHNVGTLFQYHSADYSYDPDSIYLDTTGKNGVKSATVNLTKGLIVTIVPSRTGDTVVFTPVN